MNWRDYDKLIETFKLNGSVFVKFTHGAREGAVARVLGIESTQIVLGWDNRPNKITIYYHSDIEPAPLSVGTHWVFEKNKEPIVNTSTDSLGQAFSIGDIVLYRSKKTNYFGVVEEMKPSGGIYVKRTGLINADYKQGRIERIMDRNDCIIISDNIRNVLMRKKLSTV